MIDVVTVTQFALAISTEPVLRVVTFHDIGYRQDADRSMLLRDGVLAIHTVSYQTILFSPMIVSQAPFAALGAVQFAIFGPGGSEFVGIRVSPGLVPRQGAAPTVGLTAIGPSPIRTKI